MWLLSEENCHNRLRFRGRFLDVLADGAPFFGWAKSWCPEYSLDMLIPPMSQCLMFQGSEDHVDYLWLFHTFPFLSKYKPGCWFDPKTWSKKLQINHLSIHINIQNTVGIWFDIYMMPIPWLVMVPANDSGWRKDCWSHRRRKEIAISVERDQNPGFLLLYMGEYALYLVTSW